MSSYSNGSTNARREEQTFAGKGRKRQRRREEERELRSIDTLSHSHKYLNFVTIPIHSQLKRFTKFCI